MRDEEHGGECDCGQTDGEDEDRGGARRQASAGETCSVPIPPSRAVTIAPMTLTPAIAPTVRKN